ncbi:MAG TPA: glucose-6-phosphate isomerase family protein [Methanoregulaceae archaeon]|nr:glucose-6-phosphate isomerase family protein [Methanoregulaceae archaeon]HOW33142.1 glucose-6-phosphate isomerase family protein [Methanoregulaceae archaeon]
MLGWSGPLPEPEIRDIEDMRQVLATPDCQETGPLYFMYRDLALNDCDRQWLHSHHLRYDITAIVSRDICGERVKTKGHYHPLSPSGVGYPEVYEVLRGHAHYLLQERNLSNVILVDALEKDLIIVPPGYGHVTINAGNSDLIMANIVSTDFESQYMEYEKMGGAVYYELTDGRFIKNPAYPSVPEIQVVEAGHLPKVHFSKDGLYETIGTDTLDFLNNPDLGWDLFNEVLRG